MRQLGISIYPGHSDHQTNLAYIKKAASHGFKRIFTCLLSIEGNSAQIITDFKETINLANHLGLEVVADVSPKIFKDLGINYNDLSFFAKLNLYAIRLDEGFSGNEEALMTFNPYNIKIEINMSQNTHYLDTIMDFKPNTDNLLGSHNFYPHRYSGLGRAHFEQCTQNFKNYGITRAAFINSTSATFGPWPVTDGLCTLEEHRYLSIDLQARDLFLCGIDIVIIANCYASDEELALLGLINKALLELHVETIGGLPSVEQSIIFDEIHFNRGDISNNLIRSTMPRVKYKGHQFNLINPKAIKRGDVIIESSLYGHYAGELQIAKTDMDNSGKSSIIGHIRSSELFFLDGITPWQKFKLIR